MKRYLEKEFGIECQKMKIGGQTFLEFKGLQIDN